MSTVPPPARPQAAAPQSPASPPARRSDALWVRLRPLAFLAPLAVNWPDGKMAL